MGDRESSGIEALWVRYCFLARLGAVAAVLIAFALILSARASAAALEEVGTWASSGEAVQLGGVGGMAVNVSGAGGVPAGTIYLATKGPEGQPVRVARFNPDETFSEAWEVTEVEEPYERCGPQGEPSHPTCPVRPKNEVRAIDVDVDPITGNVYVFNGGVTPPRAAIVAYSPDGSEVIARLGETASVSEKTELSPGKIHNSPYSGGIAVNAAGEVYVFDVNGFDNFYHRLMVFKPKSAGDFSEYEYAGEIAGGFLNESEYPTKPVTDYAGNIYVAGDTYIEEYVPEAAGVFPHHSTPICSFEYDTGGITALTVNPETGEPFFFSYKKVTGFKFKLIHQLGPCEGGEFKETGTIEVSPERDDLSGLAFDPSREYSLDRPLGLLYGAAPGPVPSSGVGKGEPGTAALGYSFAPSEEHPPAVESESVSEVTSTSARLQAEIDAKNFETHYAFQYMPDAAYQANEPAERQALTVSATSGILRLGFEGHSTGGPALANLTAGSATASSLITAKGSASTTTGKKANVLSGVTASFGAFEVGQPIAGPGIPASAHIVAVNPGQITLSVAATAPGVGVAISSVGPEPLAVGELIEGPGIAPGTTILDAKAGQLTLSMPASVSGTGVTLQAGLPAAASTGEVQRALQGLASIGPGNVVVTGGPGDETGSSPYEITFAGILGDADLPDLSADTAHLTGGAASATVVVEHDGGNGFGADAIEAPPGGAVLGSGEGAIAVATVLRGLAPDAGYRYRVVASSHCSPSELEKVCEVFGSDQSLRTYPAQTTALSDKRAYELVSPPQKNGGQVLPAEPSTTSCKPVECKPGDAYQHFPMQSSPNGDAIVYEGSPFFPGQGAVIENEYISRRGEAGWGTTNLTPGPLASKGGQGYKAFDANLSRGVLEQTVPSLSLNAPSDYDDLYLQSSGEVTNLTPLLRDAPAPPYPNHLPFNRLAGEGLGSLKLTYAGASADLSRLFFEANDALSSASAFAPEAVDGGESKKNLYEWSSGQLSLVNVVAGNTETAAGAVFGSSGSRTPYAISADGTHVFWSSEAGQLYVRINGKETVEIEHSGKFLTASADGSRALLADGCLYELAKAECVDLTAGKGGFLGIAGQSEDLSRLYFVDTKALTGENAAGKVPNEHGGAEDNLYAWDEGSLSFLATLLPGDNAAWQATPAQRMAEASPDGRWLAFLSKAPLTGYENTGPCELTGGGEILNVPCNEAFLYDSAAHDLTCASCSPANARPLGRTVLRLIKGSPPSLAQPRYLNNSGRLYFDTQDSLAPSDTNGNVEDVYQFEPAGIGSCARATGCVSLISAGRDGVDSNFLAMDEEGENVFFTSRDRLVPADTDELIDLYDARANGGIAAESELPPKGCGEGCLPPTSTQSEQPTSSSLTDPGNVKRQPCKKGQVKKNGRCVKKPKHKKQKSKQPQHKGGGAK